MENIKPLQHTALDPKLKFLGEYGVEVPSFTGTSWLDELTEDLEMEAVLAVLEGRDPETAVEEFLNNEAAEVPISCLQTGKANGKKSERVCDCSPVRGHHCHCVV